MRIGFSSTFRKSHRKLPAALKRRFDERLKLFADEQFSPLLRNHALRGEYTGCRSINISGDVRAIFKMLDEDAVYFIDIGTHAQLFGT